MKLDKRGMENILRNYFYTDAFNKIKHCCKQSSRNIYGKDILLFKDGETYTFELENWIITAEIDCESATLDSIQDFCRNLAQKATEYERGQLGDRNVDNCTCHMLFDWRFLENEVGGIINKGKVTLVKYAKILEDMDNED